MIPNNTAYAEVTGNMTGKRIKAGISPKVMGKIMQILAGLYGNTHLAIVREYSTNARDSHIEAKQTRPIEVNTPGAFSDFVSIRDFGVGMNAADIEETYSQYGESTKTESDDYNGTLGLGSKVAFAYAQQFNVVGVKDGVKTSVMVSREADGSGDFLVVSEVPTDEPNGVEVRIPTRKADRHLFEPEAKRFFRYWTPGTVLLNGKDPSVKLTHIADVMYESHNPRRNGAQVGVTLYKDDSVGEDYVVMANVAYPVSSLRMTIDNFHNYRSYGVVAYVEPGEVDFAPSREALSNDDVTMATMKDLQRLYKENVITAAVRDVESANGHREAFEKFNQWYSTLGYYNLKGQDFIYKGVKVPAEGHHADSRTFIVYNRDAYSKQVSNHQINYKHAMNAVYVKNYAKFDSKSVSRTHKDKVKKYLDDLSISTSRIIFLPDHAVPGAPWTDDCHVVEWDDVAAIKLPSSTTTYNSRVRTAKVYDGQYDILSNGYFSLADVDDTKTLYYFSPNDTFQGRYSNINKYNEYVTEFAKFVEDDAQIIKVGAGRVAKFLRNHPTAVHLNTLLDSVKKDTVANLTDDDVLFLAYDEQYDNMPRGLSRLNPDDVDDPELKERLRIYGLGKTDTIKKFRTASSIFGASIDREAKKRYPSVTEKNWEKRYPLVGWSNATKDVLIYINAKYAARAAEKGN